MHMKKTLKAVLPVLLLSMSFFVIPTGCAPSRLLTLNVSAAASLADALKEINGLYTQDKQNIKITANLASSGTLQKQIEQGAPVDVFVSAAAVQMDALQRQGLILSATRKDLLSNKVVLIVPGDSTLGLSSFIDLTTDKVKGIGIGDPKSVPAGMYGQQALDELGITDQLRSKLVLGSDARQVLSYVESGNIDVGIVYLTDARTSNKVRVVASAPDDINTRVVYPVAIVKASSSPLAARDYEDFLFGNQAKAVFERLGFSVIAR